MTGWAGWTGLGKGAVGRGGFDRIDGMGRIDRMGRAVRGRPSRRAIGAWEGARASLSVMQMAMLSSRSSGGYSSK